METGFEFIGILMIFKIKRLLSFILRLGPENYDFALKKKLVWLACAQDIYVELDVILLIFELKLLFLNMKKITQPTFLSQKSFVYQFNLFKSFYIFSGF